MSTLLLVHAHPDDESIATGGVMVRAHNEGHRVVLVTATRGEVGEIHNMDEQEVRPRLAEVRVRELQEADRILGVDRQEFLGYRDSGMLGTPDNQHPQSFHRAELEEAAEKLARFMREERPEVVVTYGADGTYGHPDHVKAHQVTVAAVDMLQRESWAPQKVYFTAIPKSGLAEMGRRLRERGHDNPFESGELGRSIPGTPDEEITTIVDVGSYLQHKKNAFKAHVSQNDPNSFFLNTPPEIFDQAFSTEHYVLARGFNGMDGKETDLFAGV